MHGIGLHTLSTLRYLIHPWPHTDLCSSKIALQISNFIDWVTWSQTKWTTTNDLHTLAQCGTGRWKINDQTASPERKSGQPVAQRKSVCACARSCHCQTGTMLLTSLLAQISRDFMPETCRKQNAPRHLQRADLLETPSTTWFITSLRTTSAVSINN